MASLEPGPEGYVHLQNGKVTDQQVSDTPPPYTRVVLPTNNGTTAPPLLPVSLQPHVSYNDWQEFWGHISPTLDQMKRLEKQYNPLFCSVIAFVLVAFIILLVWAGSNVGYGDTYLMYSFVLLFGYFSICLVLGTAKQRASVALAATLQGKCREQDVIFRQRGFAMECVYEWSLVRQKSTPTLVHVAYFVPLNKLTSEANDSLDCSLRIPLFATNFSLCHGKEAVSQTHLESYRTLPLVIDLAASNLWSRFWPDMMERSHAFATSYISDQRLMSSFVALNMTNLAAVSITHGTNVSMVASTVCLVGMMILLPFLCGAVQRLGACPLKDLVSDYVKEFAQHGVWIEYRRLYLVSSNEASFVRTDVLYVFSLSPRETPGAMA